MKEENKPKAEVLFIEVDGIYTSIQQSKRKSKGSRKNIESHLCTGGW